MQLGAVSAAQSTLPDFFLCLDEGKFPRWGLSWEQSPETSPPKPLPSRRQLLPVPGRQTMPECSSPACSSCQSTEGPFCLMVLCRDRSSAGTAAATSAPAHGDRGEGLTKCDGAENRGTPQPRAVITFPGRLGSAHPG